MADIENNETEEETKMVWLERSKYYAISLQCASVFLTLLNLIIYYCDVYTSWETVMTFYIPCFLMLQACILWLNYFIRYDIFRLMLLLCDGFPTFMGCMVYIMGFIWPLWFRMHFETDEEWRAPRNPWDPISPFQPYKYSIPGTLFIGFVGGSVMFMIVKVYNEKTNKDMEPLQEAIALEEENMKNNNTVSVRNRMV